MTIGPQPKCYTCKNIIIDKGDPRCKAFPEGIPDDILTWEFPHTKKYPGQENSILFEPA